MGASNKTPWVSFCTFVCDFAKPEIMVICYTNVLPLHGGEKSLSKAYLALFLSYFKTIFKMTKPVCVGFTDSHQFLEVFQQLCCNHYTWLYRGLLLLFIHQFPFHVIVISIVKVNVQLIGTGHVLKQHFHDNRSPRDCLWIQKLTRLSAHIGSA